MADNEPRYHFEENQSEGSHATAFRFDNTEIKKGQYIVATHLRDLYDVDVKTIPPEHDDVLKYDSAIEKWVPGQVASGSGCILLSGELFLHVKYNVREATVNSEQHTFNYSHGNYYDGEDHSATDENQYPIGTFENPFAEIADAIQWIQNFCRVISDEAKINIMVYSENYCTQDASFGGRNYIPLNLSWLKSATEFKERFFLQWRPTVISYPYAHRIFIYGVGYPSGSTIEAVENVHTWMKRDEFDTPLGIQYFADIDCEDCDYCYQYEYAASRFQPFLTVKNELTLGGFYNFEFFQPSVDISCSGGSTCGSSGVW